MSGDDKNSGLRGRIDRFFDKRAEEQQELITKALGGKIIENTCISFCNSSLERSPLPKFLIE